MSNLVIAALRGSISNPNSVSTKSLRIRAAGLASIAFFAAFSTTTTYTTAAMATTNAVPARMHLTDVMKNSAGWLSGASLIPIDFSPGIGDLVKEETAVAASEAISQNAGPEGSICFVVRRPG